MSPTSPRLKTAAEALRDSEVRYRRLFEAAREGILILDAETGTVVDANPFLLDLLGLAHESTVGRRIWELGVFETTIDSEAGFAAFRETAGLRLDDFPLRTADGRQIHVELACNLYPVDDHAVMQCTIRDVTERRRMEEALRTSTALLSSAIEMARLGYWEYDVATDAFTFNDPFYSIFHTTAAQMGGYTMSSADYVGRFVHPSDRDSVRAVIQQAIERPEPGPGRLLEHRMLYADGNSGHLSVQFCVVQGADGRTIKTYGVNQDITERKKAEEASSRLVTIVEQARECIVITDLDGTIRYVNPAFEGITGYTREEAVGKNPRILKSGQMDDEVYRLMWGKLTNGEVWTGHLVNRRKDGTFFEEDATISPVRDPAGTLVGYAAIKHDVTEHIQLRQQFLRAQKMETIGQLAGGVAHDFNNLLHAILGYCDIVLKQTQPNDPRREDLMEIRKTSLRAAALTRQLLASGSRQNLDLHITDLNVLIEDLNKLLGRAMGDRVRIECKLSGDLDRVMADQGQIGQILMNLAVNARDAMPQGGLLKFQTSARTFTQCEVAAFPDVRAGRFVCVSATDTGTGMSPAVLKKVFEPFFTTKAPGKGTGLGLATSYGIARQHGGWMDVESEPGAGTTFRLYLPVIERAQEPHERGSGTVVLPVSIAPAVGRNILLVEDDTVIRTMVQRQLQQHGHVVTAVSDAAAAIEQFERFPDACHVVITDCVLPGMSGVELLERLQQQKPDLHVLVSSGYTDNETRWPVIRARKWPFIAKPYTFAELSSALDRIFDTP